MLIDADELRKKLLMIDCMEDAVEIVDNQPTFDLEEIKAEGRKEIIDKVIDAIKDLESIKGGYQDMALRTKMPQRRDYIKRMEAIGIAIHFLNEHLEIKEEQKDDTRRDKEIPHQERM